MTARFRSRLDSASVVVACGPDVEHTVTLALDSEPVVVADHDRDTDIVMAALGAEPHPCQTVVNSYTAARVAYAAAAGTADPAGLRFHDRRGWYDGDPCPACRMIVGRLNRNPIHHVLSPDHQAHRHAGDPALTEKIYRWLTRRAPLPTLRPRQNGAALWHAPSSGYTPGFQRLVLALVNDDGWGLDLRAGGVTVGWLAALAANVTTTGRAQFTPRRAREVGRALAAARNCDPAVVASYLNAGITSHFWTYERVHATPEQILTVYRATGGRTTLADLLTEGLSIPDALARTAS